jgi:purine-binding chemotaxis protein CheW
MEQLGAQATRGRTRSEGGQYLTFRLGDEEYGVEILKVQEIKGYSAITPIPNTPAYLKGVMNLRGTIVPVVDLRAKFGMAQADYTPFTVIIVVTVGPKVMGLVVDAVSDVLDIRSASIDRPPELVSDAETAFIRGMATLAERLIMLVDVDQIITLESLSVAPEAAAAGAA